MPQRMADHLVEGIVTSDIFTQKQQFTRGAKKGRGMEASGAVKSLLSLAEFHWKA